MSRAAALWRDVNDIHYLKSIIIGVKNHYRICTKIINNKKAASWIKVCLVGVRACLSFFIRTWLPWRGNGFDESQIAVCSVPDINGTITIRATDKSGIISIELYASNFFVNREWKPLYLVGDRDMLGKPNKYMSRRGWASRRIISLVLCKDQLCKEDSNIESK
uniref:Uncharacterized protein n=1 Tax=Fusarium oxysporum (strain Fo5176) TaxID=660025 RepID=A0A0C4BKW0_FUSOF